MFAPAYVGRKRWAPQISYFALLERATCAARLKESRRKSINATGLHRKSGGKPNQSLLRRTERPPFHARMTISNCSPSCNSIGSPSTTVVCPLPLSKLALTIFPRALAVTRDPVEASAHDLHGKVPASVCIVNVTLPVCERFSE